MTVEPGFSSRTTQSTIRALGAGMEMLSEPVEPTVNGMDGDGWSNSDEVKTAPQDNQPEINVQLTPSGPGWSNSAPSPEAAAEATAPASEPPNVIPVGDPAMKKTTARKTTAKKG